MSQKGKKNDQVLLFPGAEGWEIWRGNESLSLLKATAEREALSVDGVPGGNLTMAFPVRDVSAAPFVAATGDKEMFRDLADLHLERSGLRASDAAGSLSDCFTLRTDEEEALLLPVVLSPPPEGGLPKKSPKAFDISARCLPMPPNAVVLWREFGRWVFAVSDAKGQTVYFQALPGALFDQQLAREVALGTAQLSMQEVLSATLEKCEIWTGEGEFPPSDESQAALSKYLELDVQAVRKPSPRIPEVVSHLLPADIRAERVAMQKARQTKLAVAAGVIAYLGLIGFLTYKFNDAKTRTEIAEKRAAASNPVAEEVARFTSKWDELQPVVENEYWPIEQYFRAYQAAPKDGLRIKVAEMHNEVQFQAGQGASLKRFMILEGESTAPEQALEFGENLKKSDYFSSFEWSIKSPRQTNTGAWSFIYETSLAL
ncbi:hypothetical protein GCM10007100_16500 [Roseibacillus persicicus]|uniref:Uncharacterized protein n=1 Tax=Roseibacillus persicicus TaxID=454148 RepID=A0A918WIM5_9BACT|nr:hypothetical protein GCM10007100_16500 [Roseibacillus persicicus]